MRPFARWRRNRAVVRGRAARKTHTRQPARTQMVMTLSLTVCIVICEFIRATPGRLVRLFM